MCTYMARMVSISVSASISVFKRDASNFVYETNYGQIIRELGYDYDFGCVELVEGERGKREGMDGGEGGEDGDGLEVRKERE
jgi:hypothetical protein